MIAPRNLLASELLLRIAECGISVPQSYYETVVWHDVGTLFRNNTLFNERLRWCLAHNDAQREYPHFCVDAATAGDFDALANVMNAYTAELGLEATMELLTRQLPVDEIEYTGGDVGVVSRQEHMEQTGGERAWSRLVMEATRGNGTFNDHIQVNYPRFNSRADADVWLNCIRNYFSLSKTLDRKPRLLDVLCIMAREGGRFSVSSTDPSISSPAFAMIDLILKPFLESPTSGVPRPTYSSLCGPVDSPVALMNCLWAHDAPTTITRAGIFPMLVVRTALTACLYRQHTCFYISGFTAQSQWKKVIDWLLSCEVLRPQTRTFVMRAVELDEMPDVAQYLSEKHAEQFEPSELQRLAAVMANKL